MTDMGSNASNMCGILSTSASSLPTFQCFLRGSGCTTMACLPSSSCDDRALARDVYQLVGLSPEMGLGHSRLYDKTNCFAKEIVLTTKNFPSYRFYAAFDFGA